MENAKLTDFLNENQKTTDFGRRIARSQLLDEIERLHRELGEIPSRSDMKTRGKYSTSAFTNAFGTWTDGLKEAGFTESEINKRTANRQGTSLTDAELLNDLKRVAEIVDQVPRVRDVRTHGKYAHETYRQRFGGWDRVLRSAGFEPNYTQFGAEVGELVDEMLRLAIKLDRPPYGKDMTEYGKYSKKTYSNRFGSWAEALDIAGLPRRERGGSLPIDVGSKFETYGVNWYEMRQQALQRDRFRCQDCGMEQSEHRDEYGRGLDVHHIMPVRQFDTPEDANILLNLITLCRDCHRKWEQFSLEKIE